MVKIGYFRTVADIEANVRKRLRWGLARRSDCVTNHLRIRHGAVMQGPSEGGAGIL